MSTTSRSAAFVLGLFLFLGLAALGALIGHAALRYKEMERTVTVKGLSEREVPADVVLWPIQFTAADNDLARLYEVLESQAGEIRAFLLEHAVPGQEISTSPPAIVDRLAQPYGGNAQIPFRYSAVQTVSVYSTRVETVRAAISSLAKLGPSGIVFKGDEYGNKTQYLFTRLNEIKPSMVEEATRNARSVAEKFAADSESRLGKIKRAHQGQFSISSRDSQTPHLKKVRVVSTVEYYLAD